jgi:mannitol-1-phosphate/altronate dehydrogenase
VEAAWTYQHRPNIQGRLLRRQKSLALNDEVKRIAWNAQQRLHKRFTALTARGKNNNQAVRLSLVNCSALYGHRSPYRSPVQIEQGSVVS